MNSNKNTEIETKKKRIMKVKEKIGSRIEVGRAVAHKSKSQEK